MMVNEGLCCCSDTISQSCVHAVDSGRVAAQARLVQGLSLRKADITGSRAVQRLLRPCRHKKMLSNSQNKYVQALVTLLSGYDRLVISREG
jgi:hypothetical protein